MAEKKKKAASSAKTATRNTKTSTVKKTSRSKAAALASATNTSVAKVAAPAAENALPWRRIDLHLHTPSSHDYETPEHGYIGILQQAERRGLSMIAFTDHNTVNGYRNMRREIEDLEMLERMNRIQPTELGRLNEYRRLLQNIVVLPGFEFSATFGFHILGIFPPDKPMRDIEHVLLQLKVPANVIDEGLTEAGATSDVLTAYRTIAEAGGLAIAAHANSTSGVSMRDMDFGGQTRIAFTQDPNLAAIEWTDLDRGRRSSANLLTGIRNEYPRRMHALQGSDAHRISVNPANPKRLGVGERASEVQLEVVSFEALRDLLASSEWGRIQPSFNVPDLQPDHSKSQRSQGAGAMQAFHPALGKKAGGKFDAVLHDIAAMANSNGGTLWLGCEAKTKGKTTGIKNAEEVMQQLGEQIQKRVHPPINIEAIAVKEGAVKIIRITLKSGSNAPHVLDENQYLTRDGASTRAATRDEIVQMARRNLAPESIRTAPPAQRHNSPQNSHADRSAQGRHDARRDVGRRNEGPSRREDVRHGEHRRDMGHEQTRPQPLRPSQRNNPPQTAPAPEAPKIIAPPVPVIDVVDIDGTTNVKPAPAVSASPKPQATRPTTVPGVGPNGGATGITMPAPHLALPKSGVEVISMEQREGKAVFALRDSRNNSITHNVTFTSARDLWHYAITMHNRNTYPANKIQWSGDRAVLSNNERAGKVRYDVAVRLPDGSARVIYGVTTEGVDDEWRDLMTSAKQNSAS